MRKKTHEEYVKELSDKNPTVEVVEKYINASTKIRHHCLVHDIYWDITPSLALNGNGCKKCHYERVGTSNKKSNEQYIDELKVNNPKVIALEEYIDSKTKIMFRCTEHNIEWKAYPDNILHGCGCSECSKEKIKDKNVKSHNQFVVELAKINPNIIVLEKYINAKTKILAKCIKHNITWKVVPDSLLQGCGCKQCGREKTSEKKKKSEEQYVSEVKKMNSNISVIDTYIGANTKILHKCLVDGHEWYATPANILTGYGCPKCCESHGERKISKYLDDHNIVYDRQKRFEDCKDNKSLPFDFYLPKLNMCIEYDGIQHSQPVDRFGGDEALRITIKHDNIKNEYCKDNGISLLRIPYFKNIEEELNNSLFI